MIVSICPIRSRNPVLGVLQRDGWQLEPGSEDHVDARHPQVTDEVSARSQINQLGLLTSACLRIAFRKAPSRSAAPRL